MPRIFRGIFSKSCVIIGVSIFSFSLNIMADEAPVVDVTQNPTSSASTDPAAPAQTQPLDSSAANNTVVTAQNSNNNAAAPDPSLSSMPADQRLARLEQQMANLVQMNLPQQITELQQNMQQLQGTLQVEEHELKTLTEQQQNFYKDLDQRINQLKSSGVATKNSNSTANNDAGANDKSNVSKNGGNLQDTQAYQAAFSLFAAKKYDDAKNAFQDYLKNHADGQFKMNAHYWLGEVLMIQKSYDSAEKEFNVVIQQFPDSDKVSDAKLKIAMIHSNQGKTDQARTELRQIKQANPNSTAAQLANIQLQQMQETSAVDSSNQ